jgi:hypothetical protein
MKDKEMIEEMARDIYYAIQKECKLNTCGHCNDCEFNVPENTNEIDCQSYLVSKILTQMNYRNCKDKVVLTREEHKIINHNIEHLESVCNDLEIRLEHARKETAREILTEIVKRLHRAIMSGYWEYPEIKDLFEKYGVEVE